MYLRAVGRRFTQMNAYFLVMNSKRCTKTVDSVFSRTLIGYSIKLIFFKVNFPVTDLSKDGLPRVKVFIPDSMPQATVQYDKETMVVHVKDPSLGWVARIEVVRDTPYAPQVIQLKNTRETRPCHTELE